MRAALISAFADELEKDAVAPQLLQKLWGSGAGRAIAGGLVGAGTGAATAGEGNRLQGALLGAGIGAGGGYAAPLVTRAGRRRALEGVKHIGRKAKHEVTGRGPAPIRKGLSQKEVARHRAADKAGLTSIPGVLKGVATRPLSTLKSSWQHAGGLGKAMAIGDLALGAPHIMDKATQEGTAEKTLGTLGTAGGYLLGGRMGLLGSMALGSGMGFLGSRAGRLFGGGQRAQEAPARGAVSDYLRAEMPTRPSTAFAKHRLAEAVPEVGRLVGPG
jgi:hypothetical protein